METSREDSAQRLTQYRVKDGIDLVDADEIKKRWKEYTEELEELLKEKDLNEPDGVVSHPEPDILEYEVKWALSNIAVNKTSGCDEIPAELFKFLKEDAIKVLHSLWKQIWKTLQWTQDWKSSILTPVAKRGSAKECANNKTVALISHVSKVMFKILHETLQHSVNQELSDAWAGLRKGREIREQIANIHWVIEKARGFQKNIYLCFIDYANDFDCVDPDKLWKAIKEMGTWDHLICLMKNLYLGQEATARTQYGTTDWFKMGKRWK